MDVPEFLVKLTVAGPHATVVAATTLPVSIPAIGGLKPRQDRRVQLAPPGQDFEREPALEFAEHGGDRVLGESGPEEEMHMFGHDNLAVQVEVEPSASVPEIEKELVADARVVQEREALVTRECDETDAAGRLDSLHPLSRWCVRVLHGPSLVEEHQFRLVPTGSPGTGGTRKMVAPGDW